MKTQFDISLHFDFKEEVNGNKMFSEKRALEAFTLMKSLGIKYFNTWCNDDVYPQSDEDDILFAKILSRRMKEMDIKMSSFHFVGSVLDCYDESQNKVRFYMERTLKIFADCKPGSIVVHPGTYGEGGFKCNKIAHQKAVDKWGREKTHAMLIENLRHFGKLAAKYDIKIAVENLFQGRFYSNVEELIGLVEGVALDNVGYCLDSGHANLDHVDIPETIRRMGSKLFEVHLHDNNGKEDQHLPIGFGNLEWISIIRALKDIGYQGTATYEFFRWPYVDRVVGIKNSITFWESLEKIQENGYFTSDWK